MDADGSGVRSFLPGCPIPLHINAGRPSAERSIVADSNLVLAADEHAPSTFTAGDRLLVKVQLRDEYGNSAALSAPDREVRAYLQTPSGTETPLVLKNLAALGHEPGEHAAAPELKKSTSKKGSVARQETALGLYEVVSQHELMLKGPHTAVLLLHGQGAPSWAPIRGTPLPFVVMSGNAVAARSWLELRGAATVPDWHGTRGSAAEDTPECARGHARVRPQEPS